VVAAAIGVGVNVGASPPAVASRTDVTSLGVAAGRPVARRRLLTAFLREFQLLYDLFERGEHEALLDAWRARSTMWDGAAITIQDAGGSRDAVTCGLTELGALRIRSAGRPLETLMAGDVTVRWAGPGTGAETPPKDG
jgi:biotin-(acetyl-CoA carboxylase) ligase